MTRPGAGQTGVRSVLVAAPVGALLLAGPAGAGRPPGAWLLALVVVAGAVWAVRPEGPAGVVALGSVVGWWVWSVPGLSAWALPAAALLLLAHHAGLVAAVGPADLRLGARLLGSWVRRSVLLGSVAVPVWGLGVLLVAGTPGAPWWVWPLAAVLTGVTGILAVGRSVEEVA